MLRPSARLPHFALLLGLAWAVAAAQLLLVHWAQTGATLLDTDDAMRLVQLRAFLAGRGWFDLHEPRLQPPQGYDSHWSRLVDAGLAGLLLLLRQVTEPAAAERLMRALWPLLWLLPTVAGMAAVAWRLAGREAATVALILAVLAVPGYQQFTPGRVDHHNVQIALAVLTVAATVWADRRLWCGWAAGALTGLALAIGLESLPYLAACGAACALRYVADGTAAPALRGYAVALAGTALAAFFLSVRPDAWAQPLCDAVAVNWLLAILAGAGVLAMAGAVPERRGCRIALVGAAAVAALAVMLAIAPRCLAGPYALIDPAIRPIWLAQVRENQPLWRVLAVNPLTGVAIAAFPLAALASAALLLVRVRAIRRDFGLLASAAVLAVAALTTVAVIRAYSYAIWLGMPLVAAATLQVAEDLRVTSLRARAALGLLLTPLALSSGAITLADAAGFEDHDDFSRPDRRPCLQSANYAALAALPPGIVAADVSFGPFMLALTPHAVLAAPYHRLSVGILSAHQALALPPMRARAVLEQSGATYVLACGSRPPDGIAAADLPRSLWAQLRAGLVPDWLEPMSARGDPLAVYRIVRPGPPA